MVLFLFAALVFWGLKREIENLIRAIFPKKKKKGAEKPKPRHLANKYILRFLIFNEPSFEFLHKSFCHLLWARGKVFNDSEAYVRQPLRLF